MVCTKGVHVKWFYISLFFFCLVVDGWNMSIEIFRGSNLKVFRRKKMNFTPTRPWTFSNCLTNIFLTALEQQNRNLSQVEVDKVARLVCDVASKVPADNAMPCWIVLFVKFLLDKCSNILLDVVLFQCLRGTIHCVLLHFFAHVGIFDNGLAITHFVAGFYWSLTLLFTVFKLKYLQNIFFSAERKMFF